MTGEPHGHDPQATPKRKPRWWLRILSTVVVLGVLAGGAEFALRQIIPGVVADQVREKFQLTPDHPVEVSLGGSALGHALVGRVGDLDLRIPEAPIMAGITVTVNVHADSVPFRAKSAPSEGVTAAVTIPREQLPEIVKLVTRGAATTGEVEGGDLTVGRTFSFWGQDIPLEVVLGVSITGGEFVVEPKAVSAIGFNLTTDDIRSFVGTALDGILTEHRVCVSDQLPRGITLTELTLSSTGTAGITAAIAPTLMTDAAMREMGTCAA